MADIAGMHYKRRRLGKRVDVGNGAAEAADDVRIRLLAKADMRIADLNKRQGVAVCYPDRAAGRAECTRNAAGNGPDDGGAAPGGKTCKRPAALGIGNAVGEFSG